MIEVKNITKVYKSGNVETKVLKGISFSISDGEFVARKCADAVDE